MWADSQLGQGPPDGTGLPGVPFIAMDYGQLLAVSLDEEESFLLTFVDGISPPPLIALRCGWPVEKVGHLLDGLVARGAVAWTTFEDGSGTGALGA